MAIFGNFRRTGLSGRLRDHSRWVLWVSIGSEINFHGVMDHCEAVGHVFEVKKGGFEATLWWFRGKLSKSSEIANFGDLRHIWLSGRLRDHSQWVFWVRV
jgi:hypothetical protein